MASRTVVFVHGMFMSCNSWHHWVEYFEGKGYNATAIPWPGRDKSVEQLRAEHPNPEVGQQTFSAVLEHHDSVIRGLDEPPIIIGHSLGGLITQLMLNRGLGAAAVAIDFRPATGGLLHRMVVPEVCLAAVQPTQPSVEALYDAVFRLSVFLRQRSAP